MAKNIDREIEEVGTLLGERLAELTAPADVKARVRADFMAAVRSAYPETERRTPWLSGLLTRARMAVAAGVATVMLSSGVVYAAPGAMPDSGLYPVKRALEQLESLTKRGETARAHFALEVARERLEEIQYLIETGQRGRIGELMRAEAASVRQAAKLLGSAKIDKEQRQALNRQLEKVQTAEEATLRSRRPGTDRPARVRPAQPRLDGTEPVSPAPSPATKDQPSDQIGSDREDTQHSAPGPKGRGPAGARPAPAGKN